jgi:hypothetical protein
MRLKRPTAVECGLRACDVHHRKPGVRVGSDLARDAQPNIGETDLQRHRIAGVDVQ